MNSGHRDYPGLGLPAVNSPTSCFFCITSLSGVVTVWWKKVQRELDSTLLSSDLLPKIQNPIPPSWSTACPFYRGNESLLTKPRALPEATVETLVAKMQALAGSPATGDAPRAARPACSGQGGVARRPSCPSSRLLPAQSRRNTFWCHDGLPREPSNS